MLLSELALIIVDNERVIDWMRQNGILRQQPPNCHVCHVAMVLSPDASRPDGFIWRCRVRAGPSAHDTKTSVRDGSYFENSRLPLSNILQIFWLWSFESSNKAAIDATGLAENTITQWYQYLRDICSWWLVHNPRQIGGPNVVVEIDESLIARRKYNRGHRVPERWVFGGYCSATQQGFLVMVPDRTAATLLPLVQQYIAPGSIIHSDQWAAYNGIPLLPVVPAYQHLTVNHSVNFVNPLNGACTNHVECYWKNAKKRFKAMCGVQTTMLDSHLDQFLWRDIHGTHGPDAFRNIVLHLSQWYPLP